MPVSRQPELHAWLLRFMNDTRWLSLNESETKRRMYLGRELLVAAFDKGTLEDSYDAIVERVANA
jgi:hypothetical protein